MVLFSRKKLEVVDLSEKQSVMAHVKHIETQIVKLRPRALAKDARKGGSEAVAALEEIRSATRRFKDLWGGEEG